MEYEAINENGEFIERDCLFEVDGELYIYSGVVHDSEEVYGYKYSGTHNAECKFNFSQVSKIYKPHNP